MVNVHLVVLVHGLWGNSSHMEYIESQLIAQHSKGESKDRLIVYNTGSHSGFLTYDGIDVNGKRISDEIRQVTREISTEKDKVTKFSIVGYSLGGLISRYAIGILYSSDFFDSIEPLNFVTFCTPHVGVLTPGSGLTIALFNKVVPYFLAHTGSQLFLKDTKSIRSQENKNNLPLLVWMTDSNSYFFKALQSFRNKTLYANVMNDKRTSWFTSSISDIDPFDSTNNIDTKAFKFSYIENYDPVVIDYSKPIYRNVNDEIKARNSDALVVPQGKLQKYFNWFKVLANVIILSPLWFVWFVTNSFIERIKLNRRVSAFFRDTSNNLIHLYDFINEDITACIDDDLKNLSPVRQQDLSPHNNEKRHSSLFDTLERDINNHVTDHTDSLMETVFGAINDNDDMQNDIHLDISKLNLSSFQKQIISSLNSLQWKKFPIIIRKTKYTHACAIVRHNDESFDEGKVVITHFVQKIFELD